MNKSYIRFLNADCLGREITFFVDGKAVVNNLPFGQFTPYSDINGTKKFSVSCLGCKDGESGSISLNFENGAVYTVAALCMDDDISLYGIKENTGEGQENSGNIRVCNLSPDISNADIYANKYKILGDVDYLVISRYICMIPETYDFSVKEGNKEKVILNCGYQRVQKGKYNTLYLIGRINANPNIRCIFSVDAKSYGNSPL